MLMTTLDRGDAPRAARRLVAAGCARAATGPECAHASQLMTSEIVTNALRHGVGDITFGVDAGPTSVRVEVGDAGPGLPTCVAADDRAERGRGMVIVNALAAAWGVKENPPRKVVWFEVPAQP